ncbi:uncharacterized protein PHACADRAFT_200028 [Phanerochaete carnosa HHB-10118-sp]|uniref:Glucose-methanol-choline oxidoreductase N-terminal domain-containing protein n=1 Tax=Phanerochaete carnosa (strain HHB-10118-sp) TaxID=650164 RepID=K5UN94_PHACS|nr:uncharacterized protein PHACADRAFT_200028 [Phanerochaete carnosa HHB-10118-sp]EKM51206.1 hypothetical protein PHACADRAFT_200028 [Phanerochaete carnosa HHB-10118-sp]
MSNTSGIDEVSGKSFDYIVVGGGGCGLTLAARLSEDPSKTVLVLESGGANLNDPELLRPASYGSHLGKHQYDWGHKTVEQNYLDGRSLIWPRGKGLGGSTAINFMGYAKPPGRHIDGAYRLSVPGFQPPPEDVQKRLEMNSATWKFGRSGQLRVGFPGLIQDGEIKLKEVLENAGIHPAPQPYDGDPNGWFWCLNTYDTETHTRSYSTTAFYLPNKDRANLLVLTSAHVHRVLIERDATGDLTAAGVEFGHGGDTHSVRASKEVILSAGALKSPQILELSGIGRKDVLSEIGVPLKLELPGVGENVQEHIVLGISWELKDDCPLQTFDLLRDPEVFAKNIELHKQGQGLFTMGIILSAFFPPDQISDKAGEIYRRAKEEIDKLVPARVSAGYLDQMQLLLGRLNPNTSSPTCQLSMVPGFQGSGPNPPSPGKRYVTFVTMINGLFSRGTIHVKSSDPNEDPDFDPRYLERNVDADVLLEATKFMRNLANISPLKDMIVKELNPGPTVQTDEQLLKWAKATFNSTLHTASSLSMLPREKGGVVDPQLKVYGTNNLRVADISIIPLHVCCMTQSTAYFIAEKAADIIKSC